MIHYIHIWCDAEGDKYVGEHNLDYDWDAAVDTFQRVREGYDTRYVETHKIDTVSGTCRVFDMPSEIEKEEEERKEDLHNLKQRRE